MLEDASNRELLDAWRAGNSAAATVLVRRYMARLTALASSRLSRKLARRLDPEDVVLSAWRSFFVANGRNRVDVPADDNLWPLLVTMTLRKIARQAAKHSADRRSIQSEAELQNEFDWPGIIADEPTPAEAAMVADEIELLMSRLSTNDREILTRRLQGEPHVSIAESVGCSERTVRRSLQRIREAYQVLSQSEEPQTVRERGGLIPGLSSSPDNQACAGGGKYSRRSEQTASKHVFDVTPTVSFDDVVLHELIGQGAFGKVYRATRRSDGSTVAVKYLRKTLWRNTSATRQLIREATVVSGLSHPGIARNYGWGCTDHGAVFTVMEWVDGETLEAWQRSSRPSVPDVVDCAISVCDALSAAHKAGVVHADLTPRNILIRKDGSCVLTDFGFSRVAGEPSMTAAAGTPGFLAPEQLSEVFGAVSESTDVYGVGGVLFFLLTGQAPFVGCDTAEIFARTLSSRPAVRVSKLVPSVPQALDQQVVELLSKELVDRPATVDEVSVRLLSIRNDLWGGV